MLAQTPDAKRAVIEVSRDLDGRVTEPLEIAVGDRLRIGATQWEKQLFNGTVVTVEGIEMHPEVKRGEGAAVSDTAVSRKARNRRAGGAAGRRAGKASKPESSGNESKAELRDESPVHITARTDDGRRVTFRHDEIRDWHDNIRLDYGYAMTIASAQGLTVDRAFLLADDRPRAGDHLSGRHPAPRGARRLRQPLAARLRHRRAPARGRGGQARHRQRRPGVSRRALVALPAQGGGARLHLKR